MNSERLRLALDSASAELEAGLGEAEAELAQLEDRREYLLGLIARAKSALGSGPPSPTPTSDVPSAPGRQLTLHVAMAQVLNARDNEPMTARELADEINGARLYRKRDGSAVEVNQIHARAKNYSNMFENVGTRIRLRGQ